MPLAEPLQQIDRTFVLQRGRKLTYFGGCDYFRLSSHPDVLRAFQKGLDRFGLNVAASRFTTGNHVLFGQLEKALTRFFGCQAAALLSNGYATNLALAQSLAGTFTHAFVDERSHGSPNDASGFLRCPVKTFAHRDTADLNRQLKAAGRTAKPIVLTDGLFSHDGSIAPLAGILRVLPRRGLLVVDDAHAAGTIGRTGKGSLEACGVSDSRIVQTISLSKAFGVYGGAILGSATAIRHVLERSRIIRGNTPLPLPLANAALTSVRLLRTDRRLRARLRTNTSRIKGALRAAGFPVMDNESPIVSVTPASRQHAARIERALLRANVFPTLIRYGAGPDYFRFAISSEHTAAQIDALASALMASAP